MEIIGGPGDRGGDGGGDIAGKVVGLGGEVEIGPVGVNVDAPPAVAGIGGVAAGFQQAGVAAGAGSAQADAGPVGGKPKHHGAGIHGEIGGAVGFQDVVLQPGLVGAVHDEAGAITDIGIIEVIVGDGGVAEVAGPRIRGAERPGIQQGSAGAGAAADRGDADRMQGREQRGDDDGCEGEERHPAKENFHDLISWKSSLILDM